MQAQAQAEAFRSIQACLETPEGRAAASFMLAQKSVEAFKQSATGNNTFLIKQNPQNVSERITESLKILNIGGGEKK